MIPSSFPNTDRFAWREFALNGFASAIGLWTLWFFTHLPAAAISERVSLLILLAYWLIAAGIVGWFTGRRRALPIGFASGLLSGILGLLALGTKLRDIPQDGAVAGAALKVNAPLIVTGFLIVSALIGIIGGAIGSAIRGRTVPAPAPSDSLYRFAIITALSMAPLIFVGGLVTSTNSGMAVPDWPNTFGSNMFLYPLGPRAAPGVFLEHSHRLFGTLAGCTTIVLLAMTFTTDRRHFVRFAAAFVFLLVCAQGILGGLRVRFGNASPDLDDTWFRFGHGVLAQIVFALTIATATFLSPAFRAPLPPGPLPPAARKVRIFATAALHSTILQLIFGALYRHTRSTHGLYAHMAFSGVVLIAMLLAGFTAAALPRTRRDGVAATPLMPLWQSLGTLGRWALALVTLQFALGWVVFLAGGRARVPEDLTQTLLRSIHQTNGAAVIAVAAAMGMLVRLIPKRAAE